MRNRTESCVCRTFVHLYDHRNSLSCILIPFAINISRSGTWAYCTTTRGATTTAASSHTWSGSATRSTSCFTALKTTTFTTSSPCSSAQLWRRRTSFSGNSRIPIRTTASIDTTHTSIIPWPTFSLTIVLKIEEKNNYDICLSFNFVIPNDDCLSRFIYFR